MNISRKSTWANVAASLALGVFLSACASKESVKLSIYTEPEGAHVVYMVNQQSEAPSPWIYLGVTPYKGATLFDDDDLESDATIRIKVMRNGYLDQIKEWNGEQFLEEAEDKGMIFWTPRLVKSE